MEIFVIVAITVTILCGYVFSHIISERQAAAQRSASATSPETPFLCERAALTAEQRKRQQELSQILGSSVLAIEELTDGFEFQFPSNPSNCRALTEFTTLERVCCPFLDISIRLERQDGKLSWRLIGREGVKQIIRAEFHPWIKR